MMRYVYRYRAKIAFRPFPQTFEQLDIYVPGFEIVNKKLNHILSLFFSFQIYMFLGGLPPSMKPSLYNGVCELYIPNQG